MRKPELLVPASSLEVLKVAVIFGADAVYIGGEVFGLRAKAKNFSMEDMKEEIRNLLEPLAINGEIHNKTVDKVAWVSWSVK